VLDLLPIALNGRLHIAQLTQHDFILPIDPPDFIFAHHVVQSDLPGKNFLADGAEVLRRFVQVLLLKVHSFVVGGQLLGVQANVMHS